PALAVGTRAAGERRRECEVQGRDLPALLRAPCVHRDSERLQQVLRRLVIAVRVLDALEDRELAARTHMDFELRHAVDEVIVDALGVRAVAIPTRLPVPL